jgi:uncharacterized membrane protein YoaK (UPF0700 family)
LSFNGGFVDTAAFLALQGLFTAHVTGNFITIGAALVFGTSGVIAKLLALPVFCASIIAIRLTYGLLGRQNWPAMPTLLSIMTVLLLAAGVMAITFGPFGNVDTATAIWTGMTFVAAMAIQNAAHKIHLGAAPPSTLMTGTTTQLMIDVGNAIGGWPTKVDPEVCTRMKRLTLSMFCFAFGAASAALIFSKGGDWCFVVPPLVSLAALTSLKRPTPQAL